MSPPSGDPALDTWTRVHDVVGPLVESADTERLYLHGGSLGAGRATSTGLRRELVVRAYTRGSFATYFNLFPATYWRRWTPVRRVRLRLALSGAAVVVLRASDADGTAHAVAAVSVLPGKSLTMETSIAEAEEGGLLWFELTAGADDVTVLDAAWEVQGAPRRDGGILLGTPTLGRPDFLAATLDSIADAPALLARLTRVVVVDHGATTIWDDPGFTAAATRLSGVLRVIRQPNLGGSGGFSRVLLEALETPGAGFATLLDDDIRLEPASVVRAHEFARFTTEEVLVGGQMLDLDSETTIRAAAEVIDRHAFWWGPRDDLHARQDLHAVPVSGIPWLHRRQDTDYAGWWMCQIPLAVVQRIGLALPLFLKWDDAEYGLRAAAVGVPTVSMPGTAVWHVAWQAKDDTVEWPAYFHARNRMITALLHGPVTDGAGVLRASSMLDVKQLLSLQYSAVRLRHEALHDVLGGPERLAGTVGTVLDSAKRLSERTATVPVAGESVDGDEDDSVTLLRPAEGPAGRYLGVWTLVMLLRQLLSAPQQGRSPVLLSRQRGRWWVVAGFDSVLVPVAGSDTYRWYRRDRRSLVLGLVASARLHRRLRRDWPLLAGTYRAAAAGLSSRGFWADVFAASEAPATRRDGAAILQAG